VVDVEVGRIFGYDAGQARSLLEDDSEGVGRTVAVRYDEHDADAIRAGSIVQVDTDGASLARSAPASNTEIASHEFLILS
jgi:hypothetical protein